MTIMSWNYGRTPSRPDHWGEAFHVREVATLPQQLAARGKSVDKAAVGIEWSRWRDSRF